MPKTFFPPTTEELREALEQFKSERPRAAAVMAAAWVDDGLRALLAAYLGRDKKVAADVLQEGGPLGSFGVRIKMAYLLGLITDGLRAELDTIRKVRNEFAHVRTRVSFKTEKVKNWTESLATAQILGEGLIGVLSTQEKFIVSAYLAAEVLIGQADGTTPSAAADFHYPFVRRLTKKAGLQELLAAIKVATPQGA
jgi:DNA-binding MltR family transcriptional regulator